MSLSIERQEPEEADAQHSERDDQELKLGRE
jgi:hypothetical protein